MAEKKQNEFLYFASRNFKLKLGFFIIAFFALLMLAGPLLTPYQPRDRVALSVGGPSLKHFMGTTSIREDVWSQYVYGIRSTFLIGVLGGTMGTIIGLAVGFFAGYKGGWIDEGLMMLTSILMVIPTVAILIIIAAYLPYRGVVIQSVIIGCTSWPWVALAVRSQTFSLKARGFVSLSRISGVSSFRTIIEEIAPNMASYVVMIFILLFGGAILYAVALDFIGLGPVKGISLGLMMQESYQKNAINLGYWWWFIPPGATITLIVSALYFMNTGLDEVFNPKLREL